MIDETNMEVAAMIVMETDRGVVSKTEVILGMADMAVQSLEGRSQQKDHV